MSWLFFFFQAEDGIRDYKVTGVQTCALPICHGRERREQRAEHHDHAEQPRRHVDAIVDRVAAGEHGGEARPREDQPHEGAREAREHAAPLSQEPQPFADRKSTRLNSSHLVISYAGFCLPKKHTLPATIYVSDESLYV